MPTKFVSSLHHEGLYWGGSMWWGVSLAILGVVSGALVLAAVTVKSVDCLASRFGRPGALDHCASYSSVAKLDLETHRRIRRCPLWCLPDRLSRAGFALARFGGVTALSVRGHLRHLRVSPVAHNRRLNLGSAQGTVTLILGPMLYLQWPSIARWSTGVLVSVSLITSGVTLFMLSSAARNAMAAVFGGDNQDDSSAKEYWRIHSYWD